MKHMTKTLMVALLLAFSAQAKAMISELQCDSPAQFDSKTGAELPNDLNSQVQHSCRRNGNFVVSLKFSTSEENVVVLGLKSELDPWPVEIKFPSRKSAAHFAELMRSGAVTGFGVKPGVQASYLEPVDSSKIFITYRELNSVMKFGFKLSSKLGMWLED